MVPPRKRLGGNVDVTALLMPAPPPRTPAVEMRLHRSRNAHVRPHRLLAPIDIPSTMQGLIQFISIVLLLLASANSTLWPLVSCSIGPGSVMMASPPALNPESVSLSLRQCWPTSSWINLTDLQMDGWQDCRSSAVPAGDSFGEWIRRLHRRTL